MMTWIYDANAWVGLATLIGLEIVLGVDNLVFTAILAERLPPAQRRKAQLVGLSLALVMRLALLAVISVLAQLTKPLVTIGGFSFSGRDMILVAGGAFLLAKGVTELHERIDASEHGSRPRAAPAFWKVIVQIILLDLVFSLDSIITAIGMVEQLSVMVIAVLVAVSVMMLAAGPLTAFVNRRPTVVILCLGFLLMIGFSLITEGFGFHIPKAYLYAAIVFSVLVEAANELRRRNQTRRGGKASRRERAATAIVRFLGGGETAGETPSDGFSRDEQMIVAGALEFGERRLRSLMTPRGEVEWIDIAADEAAIRERLSRLTHSTVVLAYGRIDDVRGIARTLDLLRGLSQGSFDPLACSRAPLVLPDALPAVRAVDALRTQGARLAVVVDEHGSVQGVITPFDILEAIAGDFPAAHEPPATPPAETDGVGWIVEGAQDVRRLGAFIDHDLADPDDRYTTVAGLILTKLERLPTVGDRVAHGDLWLDVLDLAGHNAGRVRIAPTQAA